MTKPRTYPAAELAAAYGFDHLKPAALSALMVQLETLGVIRYASTPTDLCRVHWVVVDEGGLVDVVNAALSRLAVKALGTE